MKKYQFLFIISILVILFSGCSDDDGKDPMFGVSFVKQTKWSGTLTSVVDRKVEGTYGITFYFTSENTGTYTMDSNYDFDEGFDYTINDKLFVLVGHPGHKGVNGKWILQEITNNTLSFRKNLTNDYNYCTLELKKIQENGRPSGRN